jgi:hypothetical protein
MEQVGRNEQDAAVLDAACEKLERAAALLRQLAANGRRGAVPAAPAIAAAIALAENARNNLHGARPRLEGSARERLLAHFRQNEGEVLSANELAEVSGIHAWARRVRELRELGHNIEHLGGGNYRYRDRYLA